MYDSEEYKKHGHKKGFWELSDKLSPTVKIIGGEWIMTKTEKSSSYYKNVKRGRYEERLWLILECGHKIPKQCDSPKNRTNCFDCGEKLAGMSFNNQEER